MADTSNTSSAAVTATWTSATAVDTVLGLSVQGYGDVTVTLTPTGTISDGLLRYEVSDDGGTTWHAFNLTRMTNGGGLVAQTLNIGGEIEYVLYGHVSGLTDFRIRLEAAIVNTGSETIRIQAFSSPATVMVVATQLNPNSLRVQLGDGTYNSVLTPTGALLVSGVMTTKTDLTPSAPTVAVVGTTSAQVVAANAARTGLILTNVSTRRISLGFGFTAVVNSGVTIYPGGSFYMDEYDFDLGAVNAISTNAASNLAIQEYTT